MLIDIELKKSIDEAFQKLIPIKVIVNEYILDYNDEHIDIKEITFDIVNISGNSELNNKIIREYIEALDLFSETKTNASRMLDDLF